MSFDISLLDTDPLFRGDMVNCLRLFKEDYPAGFRHHGHINGSGCMICDLIGMNMLQTTGAKVIINPEFAPFITSRHDQAYVDAIKGWIAYSAMADEVEAASG